jgi:hypothetical protein
MAGLKPCPSSKLFRKGAESVSGWFCDFFPVLTQTLKALVLVLVPQSEGKRNTSEGDYTALIDVPLLVTMQRSPCLRHSLHERINWR